MATNDDQGRSNRGRFARDVDFCRIENLTIEKTEA